MRESSDPIVATGEPFFCDAGIAKPALFISRFWPGTLLVETNAIILNLDNALLVESTDDFLEGFFTHVEGFEDFFSR